MLFHFWTTIFIRRFRRHIHIKQMSECIWMYGQHDELRLYTTKLAMTCIISTLFFIIEIYKCLFECLYRYFYESPEVSRGR